MSEIATSANGSVQIRKAGLGDLQHCADIVNDWIDETKWMPRIHSHNKIESFFTPDLLDNRHLLVAESEKGVIGYLSMDHQHHIHAVYLRPAARSVSIGTALLNAAKAKYPDFLRLGVLVPNIKAQKFYKRHGFVENTWIQAENTDEGVAEMRMQWTGDAQ